MKSEDEDLGPPANPRARCMAPDPDDLHSLCGKHATEQRVISEVVFALCGKHAAEVDEDDDD